MMRSILTVVDIFRAMEDSLKSSRCAIVVLCPTFVNGYNEKVFHLQNLITNYTVIYIFYGELDVANVIEGSVLGAAITASIKNSRQLTWSWPIENDAQLSRREKLFFRHLKLAIPNRRRRTTVAGDDQSPPASTRPSQSSETDSVSEGRRPLLPTIA